LSPFTDPGGDPGLGVELLEHLHDPVEVGGGLPGVKVIPLEAVGFAAPEIPVFHHQLVAFEGRGNFRGVVIFGIVAGCDQHHGPGWIHMGNVNTLGKSFPLWIPVVDGLFNHHLQNLSKAGSFFSTRISLISFLLSKSSRLTTAQRFSRVTEIRIPERNNFFICTSKKIYILNDAKIIYFKTNNNMP
jgi:hypothetical protein